MDRLKELEEKIDYRFRNPQLLRQALIHSSYANERHLKKHSDNERLEFLGDAVLELTSSEFLYEKYPDYAEGQLTKLRASLVCEPTLAFCTQELDLGRFLYLGKGEDHSGGRKRKSILSDALEAVIGAIYLDGGFANAKEFVLKYILTDIEHKQLFFDSKTILQEVVQAKGNYALEYKVVHEAGPDHDKHFWVEVQMDETTIGAGEGHTKKAAEQEAAYQALLKIKQRSAQENGGNDVS